MSKEQQANLRETEDERGEESNQSSSEAPSEQTIAPADAPSAPERTDDA